MDTVLAVLRASRLKLAGALFAGVTSGLGIAGLIALINTALATHRVGLPALLPVFAALCVLVFVARTLSELQLVQLSQQVVGALRSDLARRIVASPLSRVEQHGAHRLLAALTEDVQKIAALLTRLPTFCINAAVAVGCFAYMGWLSWPLMLAALGCVGTAVGGFCLAQGRAQRALQQSRSAGDELYKHFIAVTQGTKELQLHQGRRRIFLGERLDRTIARMRTHFVAGMTIYAVAESLALLVFFVFIGVLIFWPGATAAAGSAVLTGYALTFLYLITPIEVLVNTAPDLGQFRIALRALAELELSLHRVHDDAAPALPGGPLRVLSLRGVTHAYRSEHEDGSFLLGPLDLSLRPGEIVFITGGNGSGKTTLAKLLAGLYRPDSGSIHVNDLPVADGHTESYRQLFACVFSDFFLFDELLGLDDPQLEPKARELLAKLRLDHKVSLREGRFSTVQLSQGQRKRLALLAAVLEDRPIYLFDEWAADQDPTFKRVFYTEILPFLKERGKAVVAITHDDAYFSQADRHIKLESGRIVDTRSADPAQPVRAAATASANPRIPDILPPEAALPVNAIPWRITP